MGGTAGDFIGLIERAGNGDTLADLRFLILAAFRLVLVLKIVMLLYGMELAFEPRKETLFRIL